MGRAAQNQGRAVSAPLFVSQRPGVLRQSQGNQPRSAAPRPYSSLTATATCRRCGVHPCPRTVQPSKGCFFRGYFTDVIRFPSGSSPAAASAVTRPRATPTPSSLKAIPAVLSPAAMTSRVPDRHQQTAGFVLPLQEAAHAEGQGARAVISPTRELSARLPTAPPTRRVQEPAHAGDLRRRFGERPRDRRPARRLRPADRDAGRLVDPPSTGSATCRRQAFRARRADRACSTWASSMRSSRIIKMLPAKRQNPCSRRPTRRHPPPRRALPARARPSRSRRATRPRTVAARVPRIDKDEAPPLVHLFGTAPPTRPMAAGAGVHGVTKHSANRLAEQLLDAGVERAAAIHGNKSQSARVRAPEDFRGGRIRALV